MTTGPIKRTMEFLLGLLIVATVWRCSDTTCGSTCPSGETCVDNRCRRPCSSQIDCDAGTVCFKGYCEVGNPMPGDSPSSGDPAPNGDNQAGDSQLAICGNNQREGTEVCDGTDLAGTSTCESLSFGTAEPVTCMQTCMAFDLSQCSSAPSTCNGARVQAHEQCDGDDLAGQSCTTLGFLGGDLACNPNCSFDVSKCTL